MFDLVYVFVDICGITDTHHCIWLYMRSKAMSFIHRVLLWLHNSLCEALL